MMRQIRFACRAYYDGMLVHKEEATTSLTLLRLDGPFFSLSVVSPGPFASCYLCCRWCRCGDGTLTEGRSDGRRSRRTWWKLVHGSLSGCTLALVRPTSAVAYGPALSIKSSHLEGPGRRSSVWPETSFAWAPRGFGKRGDKYGDDRAAHRF